MSDDKPLSYLEWQAVATLYKHRDRVSSPVRYVGLSAIITTLMGRHPPLVAWVGKPSQNQVHITDEGIAIYEANTGEAGS